MEIQAEYKNQENNGGGEMREKEKKEIQGSSYPFDVQIAFNQLKIQSLVMKE